MPPPRKLSKIPPELLTWLHNTFVERAFGDIEAITEELNELMKKAGVAISIGKSAIGEESLRVKRAQESIAATTRAMQLIADTARDDADKRGEALNAIVAEGMFEALLLSRESEAEADPAKRIAMLNKAALAAGRLTTTSVRQRQWRHQVEERAKAAADAVSKIAKKGGMSRDQVAEIRAQIMGIAKVPAQQPPQQAAQEVSTPAT